MEPKCATVYRAVRSNARSCSARGAALSDAPTFERRIDPIVGRQVYIAEDRAERPSDFVVAKSLPDTQLSSDVCPFCVGNEHLTPATLAQVVNAEGQWQVRVVPNKYPAVAWGTDASLSNASLLNRSGELPAGAHEVFIECPRHVQDVTELMFEEFALVLQMYRERLQHWLADERVESVTIFKNVGQAAGASLEHVHSQLVALPEIPTAMRAELGGASNYFAAHGRCVFCDLLDEELTSGERLVLANEQFAAFCAYAGRQPYEMWILPRKHAASFGELSDAEIRVLAEVLQDLVERLQIQVEGLSYNLLLHTAPKSALDAPDYHWHFELVPRSTRLAGLEWGAGVHINPLAPERAAARLVASGQ